MENKNFKNSTIMKIKINFQAKLLLITLLTVSLQLLTSNVFSQNVGINETGSLPDNSALLDLSSTERGLLVPRMTTTERDAITTPANSLLIFNTTTQCYEGYNAPSSTWVAFGCIGCTVPTGVSATAAPNPICEGSDLTLTGGATGATSWSWTGPNGYTSSSQSPTITGITTAGAGVYTLTASNTCGSASAVNTASVTVTPNNTITLTSAAETNNQITCINTAITNITYSTTGATGATFSGLPAGVTGSWAANVVTISGTPTASGTFNYTVTLTGGCGTVTATGTITVNAAPTTANAGSDINPACDATTATLAGNTPTIGTGTWSVVSGTATITTPSSPTSGVTGLTVPGTATLRWTISNSPCTPSTDDVVITTSACFTCGTSTVSFTYNGSSVTYGTVANNGKCWLDRNLGASQVAISSTDANAYGDLFQWGRGADGHQIRTSGTTDINSPTDNPGHSNFITEGSSPYDWRVPQNNNLWQGVSGTNNPCPSGWRLPTQAEWEAEKGSWSSQNAAGAFASPLKLPVAGVRNRSNGSLILVGSFGYYWSTTIDGSNSRGLNFGSSSANMSSGVRANGFSVRCIKD